MQTIAYPAVNDWSKILKRPVNDASALEKTVRKVLHQIKRHGDPSVRRFTHQFDGIRLRKFEVSKKEIREASKLISEELKNAIQVAATNIRKFHEQQLHPTFTMETMPGITCMRKSVGIEKVGLYIPGGSAPLFSTILMLGIPANVAGCKEIVLCSPPDKEGKLHPAILYAAQLVGVTKIFKIGGVQAIGAMAYGTKSVPGVYKIFGPGNQYVTAAKMMVQMDGVSIDMPAGPSEVCVLADDSANPACIAADLLSQAEHGADSQVLLVSTEKNIVEAVNKELEIQLQKLPRLEFARKALQNSKAILMKDIDTAMDMINEYAPEHLIISCKHSDRIAEKVINAGSVFIGHFSPESVGDYASGTNHTLPTNGFAKMYSGVSVDSFVKKITFQQLTKEGLEKISESVIAMAEAEGLTAHAEAVRVRFK